MAHIPRGASGQEGWAGFTEATPLSHLIFDRPIKTIPLLAGGHMAVASLVSMGAGTPAVAEINTSEMGGFTTDGNNDSVAILWVLPVDIDLAKDIDLRGLWSNSESAGTGTGLLKFKYKSFTAGTTAVAVPATACDTDASAQTDLGANIALWSGWSTISGGTISTTPGDDYLGIKGYVTLDTIADMTVYAYQIRYYRKYLN